MSSRHWVIVFHSRIWFEFCTRGTVLQKNLLEFASLQSGLQCSSSLHKNALKNVINLIKFNSSQPPDAHVGKAGQNRIKYILLIYGDVLDYERVCERTAQNGRRVKQLFASDLKISKKRN